jgi:hypothetical protein
MNPMILNCNIAFIQSANIKNVIKLIMLSTFMSTFLIGCANGPNEDISTKPVLFEADNPLFQYVGRIDFSDTKKPRFWSPGVYIKAKFKGPSCTLLINDQELWGQNHNYLEIVIDDKPVRIQTKGKINEIIIADSLANTTHTHYFKKYRIKYWLPGVYRFALRSPAATACQARTQNGIHW